MIRPARRIEQAEVAVEQIDRHQHADRRHHLGRQHPQQDVLACACVGANAIDQAAGMAISSAISVEPPAITIELMA